jgi:abortive infection bacteriophage resistance protein
MKRHSDIISKVRADTQLNNDYHPHPGVVSYAKKHDPDHMPSWIVRECVSFGTWVKIFDSMSNEIRLIISESFSFKKYNSKSKFSLAPNAFASWVRAISILRNVCAHNGIIVNKIFSHPPSPHESVPAIKNTPGPNILDRVKVMECFLSFISESESNKFINDIRSIIYKHESSGVDELVVKKIFGFDKADL